MRHQSAPTETLLNPGYATINFENGYTIRVMVREAVLTTQQIPVTSMEDVNPRWIAGGTTLTLEGEVDESLPMKPRATPCDCASCKPVPELEMIPIRVRRGSE